MFIDTSAVVAILADEPEAALLGLGGRDGAVPAHLLDELSAAAAVAEQLDRRMEQLHTQVHGEHDAEGARDRDAAETELAGDELLGRLLKLAQRAD